MILRVLLTQRCHRDCPGCCNKDWDLDRLPVLDFWELPNYDEIILTGGEPMLISTEKLEWFIDKIRADNAETKIYIYTNLSPIPILHLVDGFTYTIHSKGDIETFEKINTYMMENNIETSAYLNVFEEAGFEPKYDISRWKRVKLHIEWIKNCPLPQQERFVKYELY